jgi:hypothetical protein
MSVPGKTTGAMAIPYSPQAQRRMAAFHPTRRFSLAALSAGFAPHCRRSDAVG